MVAPEFVAGGLSTVLLQNIVRTYSCEPAATITDCQIMPFANNGSGHGAVQHLHVAWRGRNGTDTADWIVKDWEQDGGSEQIFDLKRPLEMLAWEHGLLRPAALPAGVVVPFIWAGREPRWATWERSSPVAGGEGDQCASGAKRGAE